ncbi:hypothetical protein ScPMuIL_000308 [Solemya velum]
MGDIEMNDRDGGGDIQPTTPEHPPDINPAERQLDIDTEDIKKGEAFDSVDRETMWKLLAHYGVPHKIINVIKLFYKNFEARVIHNRELSDAFIMTTGVRQRCLLSPMIFIVALDWIMKETTKDRRIGIRWTLMQQLEDLDFADDIVMLSQSINHIDSSSIKMSESLMDFSVNDENSILDENGFRVPSLAQTPVIKNSILKPSNKDNLIQLATPIHKNLKVHFNTPRSATPASPSKFDVIRHLDDIENWAERTSVVTKRDHAVYASYARDILSDLIERLPLERVEGDHAAVPDKNSVSPENGVDDVCQSETLDNSCTGQQMADELLVESSCNPITLSTQSAELSIITDSFMENETIASPNITRDLSSSSNTHDSGNQITLRNDELDMCDEHKMAETLPAKENPFLLLLNKDFDSPRESLKEPVNAMGSDVSTDVIDDPFKSRSFISNSPTSKLNTDLGLREESGLCLKNIETSDKTSDVADISNSKVRDEETMKQSPSGIIEESMEVLSLETLDDIELPEVVSLEATSDSPTAEKDMDYENIDPFATKSKVDVSPKLSALEKEECGQDNVKPKDELINSPSSILDDFENNDPFSSKSQMQNSPKCHFDEGMNPFESKSKVPNSPGVHEINFDDEINPFESKSKVSNSPSTDKITFDEGINPFESKSKVPNSPNADKITFDSEMNPFESKSKVPNSPGPHKIDTMGTLSDLTGPASHANCEDEVQDLDSQRSTVDDLDPFKSKSKISNSPKLNGDVNMDIDAKSVCNSLEASNTLEECKERNECSFQEDGLKANEASKDEQFQIDMKQFDMMLSQDLSNRVNDNTSKETEEMGNEFFYPASQVFGDPAALDMLEQFGKIDNSQSSESSLSRISLYVKFDPLVDEVQGKTPNTRRISLRPKQIEILKELGSMDDNILLFGTPTKEMVNSRPKTPRSLKELSGDSEQSKPSKPIVDFFMCSPEEKPTKSNTENIDSWDSCKVLENEFAGTDGIVEVLKYSETDLRAMLARAKLEFQGQMLSKEKEWCLALSEKEEALQASQNKAKALKQEKEDALQASQKDFDHMKLVIGEYEKIINEMIGEKERCKTDSKESIIELRKERDQALQDIQAVENAFADLHRRYEKSKSVVGGFKKNEETLKACLEESQGKLKKSMEAIQSLKKDAEEKLDKANKEIEKLHTASQSEKVRFEATLKRKSMQVDSLEKSLEQKVNENKELIELLDSMMAKLEKK